MKWNSEKNQLIGEYIKQGLSNVLIAKEFDCSEKSLTSHMWKDNIRRKDFISNNPQNKINNKKSAIKKKLKVKKLALRSLIPKSEGSNIDYYELLKKINKCIDNSISSPLAGHRKLRFVYDRFFIKNSTDEYIYYVDDYFVRTGLYNGVSVLSGEKPKEKLLNWKTLDKF